MQHDTKSSEHICMGEICLQFKQLFVYISQLTIFGISLCILLIWASLDRVLADNKKILLLSSKNVNKQILFTFIFAVCLH